MMTFPIKWMIDISTPDVRLDGNERNSVLAMFLCVFWLAVLSYLLTECLTLLGNFFHLNGSIMGLTIGAWAASYPAVWSSIVVARDGFGDIVSCNAIGSIIFSNFIGLGLPWATYSLVNNGIPYQNLMDDGVVLSFILLIFVLIGTYCLVALSTWTLRYW